MDQVGVSMLTVVATGGLFAPLLFVLLYLLRPALFLPVVFLCISGGILFGAVAGTILSIIGITASSMLFYGIAQRFPRSANRILMLKQKLIGRHTSFTTGQVALMRLVPFIHFHILSVCLMENNRSWRSWEGLDSIEYSAYRCIFFCGHMVALLASSSDSRRLDSPAGLYLSDAEKGIYNQMGGIF